jgi:hypothetical protein
VPVASEVYEEVGTVRVKPGVVVKDRSSPWPGLCGHLPMNREPRVRKKTDHRPLEPELKPEGPNRAGKHYPNPIAAQDLDKKTDTEQPHGAGGT